MNQTDCGETGIPLTFLASMLVIYLGWNYLLGLAAFVLSSSSITRRITVNTGVKMFTLWHHLKSFALVKISWKISATSHIQQPVMKFLLGHGSGGRRCGSIMVYSPPIEQPVTPESQAPFTD